MLPSTRAHGRVQRSERIGSVVAGSSLAAGGIALLGFTRKIGTGLALIAVGAALIERGAVGWCGVKALMGKWRGRHVAPDEPLDFVDRESFESFPASDAPSHHQIS